MGRFLLGLVVLMMISSACNTIPPVPEVIGTASPSPTQTVSAEEMTSAVNFQSTLPASFTPTITPSLTATPIASNTPTATSTATAIPEDILCEDFVASLAPSDEAIPLDDLQDFYQFFIPYDTVRITLIVTNLETGEIAERAILNGNVVWDAVFTPEFYPDIAEYEWVATLQDSTRLGLCERRGTFDTRADELQSAESTAEVTVEAISEATSEVTPEMTAEATPEAVRSPVPFPPR